jgi:hypothetical protein
MPLASIAYGKPQGKIHLNQSEAMIQVSFSEDPYYVSTSQLESQFQITATLPAQ